MSKKQIYLLGLITLLGFPIVGILILWYFSNASVLETLELDAIYRKSTFLGLILGVLFALLSLKIFNLRFFKSELDSQLKLILSLKLSLLDKVFLSFCAGFGEEILFRSSIQQYLGVWITSILFIAIHGYFNPKNWKVSLYGLYLMPFILLLAVGFNYFSLWFSIAAHFSYDLVLFMSMKEEEEVVFFKKKAFS